MSHLRRAYRSTLRARKFSLSVITCWTLGLVAATMTYALVDAYFIRPPAYVSSPEHVVRLYATSPSPVGKPVDLTRFSFSYLTALEGAPIRAQFAAYAIEEQSALLADAHATLSVAAVSPKYFDVMGVHPIEGRLFAGDEKVDGTAVPIVLSQRVWRRYFGNDARPSGQIIRIRDRHFIAIGTLPDGFTGGEAKAPDAWVPLEAAGHLLRGSEWRSANAWWLTTVARLEPSTDVRTFESAVRAVLIDEVTRTPHAALRPSTVVAASLQPGSSHVMSPVGQALALVSAAGMALLLISSVNVAGLFLLRGLARRREMLICRALGASSISLAADVLAEVLVLLLFSTTLAVVVVLFLGEPIIAAFVPDTTLLTAGSRLRIVAIGAAASLAALLVCGAIALSGIAHHQDGFPTGMDRSAGTRGQGILRLIIGGQSAATAILVAGSMLLAVSLVKLESLDLGLDITDVTLVSLGRGYASENPQAAKALLTQLGARLEREPVVKFASLAISAPFQSSVGVAVNTADHPEVWQNHAGVPYLNAVSASYFKTIGMRVLRGRLIDQADSLNRARVALVNETFAKLMSVDREPLGRCIVLGAEAKNPCYTVVGVVADARRFALVPEEPSMQVYIPHSVNPFDAYPTSTLLIKTVSGRADAIATISRTVREVLPPAADVSVSSLEEVVDPQIRPWRTSGRIWGLFALAATFLTCVGVYATLAYTVEQRKREIAIRQALGAAGERLYSDVALTSCLACFVGIAAGCSFVIFTHQRALIAFERLLSYSSTIVFACGVLVAIVVTVATALPIRAASRKPLAHRLQD